MARRRSSSGAVRDGHRGTAPEAIPIELTECWIEDWLDPGEHPPVDRTTRSGEDDAATAAWAWLASTAVGRQGRARARWAAENGLTLIELAERHPRTWSAPRWRTPPPVLQRRRAARPRPEPVPPPVATTAPTAPRVAAPEPTPSKYGIVSWNPWGGSRSAPR